MAINQKNLMRKLAGFANMGFALKYLAERKGRRDLPFFSFEGREYTYGETCVQARRWANLLLYYKERAAKDGRIKPDATMAVGLYLDNCPEFAFALFGAALADCTIVGANTGFRGDTLAKVLNDADCELLVTGAGHLEEVERILGDLDRLGPDRILVVGGKPRGKFLDADSALKDPEISRERPLPKRVDLFTPLIVIYTSGTTGPPKGVPCSHVKLLGAGALTWFRMKLGKQDKGYVCMPMFHSNAWYLGIMPLMFGGGSFVLKPKFSASAFENDILEHGVTYLNYVGQPIHYILAALEKKYGTPEAVEAALARHPQNRFRIATGNGAPPVDRDKMIRYLGMDHIYELYGTTEAPINTVLKPGDPPDSVGKVTSKKVVILNEHGQVCPPAEVDARGKIGNYDQAVGEICKVSERENIFFDGYFKNEEASSKRFRDGYFRSGDLGYIREVEGNRYLYFVGRTDDWIRKDGENFSAESVLRHVLEHPEVALAAAYGAPCEVADEKVMVALKLHPGKTFDPRAYHDWFKQRQEEGMDPKWMPDFIRLVDGFEMTHQTQKILVRPLKREHYNVEKVEGMTVFFRERGDDSYKPLDGEAFAGIKKKFEEMGRGELLTRGLD